MTPQEFKANPKPAATKTRSIVSSGLTQSTDNAKVSPTKILTQSRFDELDLAWHNAWKYKSNIPFDDPNYLEVVAYGNQAVPCILHAIALKPSHWCNALFDIVPEDPVPDELSGMIEPICKCWVEWGKAKGYIS